MKDFSINLEHCFLLTLLLSQEGLFQGYHQSWNRLENGKPVRPVGITWPTGEIPVKPATKWRILLNNNF
jgi:hypothetical protein